MDGLAAKGFYRISMDFFLEGHRSSIKVSKKLFHFWFAG